MRLKRAITAVLLAFVGLSLAAIVVKEVRRPAAPPTPSANAAAEASHVVAFYFHGNMRCPTCKAIEAQSQEAIGKYFADQLKSGELEWRLVNYDSPENEHFRDDFQISFQSVILTEEAGGRVSRWKNLVDVWTKIHEPPPEFEQYVVDETSAFLVGGGS